MRPLELKLRNFRSYYGDEAVFDFRDRRLVGIVGPIGGGKSSILDAIAFALYGKTPSVGSATKSLIHQRADEATVLLRFEVEGEIWEAVRMLRRKGASQHALYRYALDDADDPIEKVSLEGEVNARVVELLGLEFDAFGRSVLLAQGRFAEFLRSPPAERDKVLKGVFGHDRVDAMREVARGRANDAAVEAEKFRLRVEQAERLAVEINGLRSGAKEAEARLTALRNAEPELTVLERAITDADMSASEAERRITELKEQQGRFPDPARVDTVISEADSAGELRAQLATALADARERFSVAERAVAAAKEAGDPDVIDKASSLIATIAPLSEAFDDATDRGDRVAARLESQRAGAEAAGTAVATKARVLEEASRTSEHAAEGLESAGEALHSAQHADMAASLRSGLAAGQPCPVCSQNVSEIPPPLSAPELETARTNHAAAVSARDEAEAARTRAGEEQAGAIKSEEAARIALAGLIEEVAAGRREVDKATAAVKGVDKDLVDLLGPGDPIALLKGRREKLDELGAAVVEAREQLDRTRADQDQAIRDEQTAGNALSSLRIELVDLGARAGVSIDDGDSSPGGVATLHASLRSASAKAAAAAEKSRGSAERERETALEKRQAMLSDLEIDGEFSQALSEVTARAALLGSEIERRETELESSAGLVKQHDAAMKERATYERITADLTDARFVRYLLDEERTRLAALGSDHFLRLSSGRYLFSADGRFNIVDQTAADAVRKPDSLSGGETFVASLALALSLAEMVARTGGRLDSFFLDEGFGSLDPEHLDLAMDGIEALVAAGTDRLVVVVSHVPELRERVEDLIVLDRDATTGDTIVRQA